MYSKAGTYLTAFLKKNTQRILEHLPDIVSDAGKKKIHKVRVSVKKLDALYRLLEFTFPARFSRKKEYQKIKKLFKKLGKYRELQLCNEYLKSLYLPSHPEKIYRKFYTSEKHKILKHLNKEIKDFDKDVFKSSVKLTRELCSQWKDSNAIEKIKEFIAVEVKEIEKAFVDFRKRKNIHAVRKRLKVIKYQLVFLQAIKPSAKIKQQISYLEDTETLIGNWHDRVIRLRFLAKMETKKLKTEFKEKESLTAIAQRLSNQNKITLTELKPRVKDIILTLKFI